MILADTSGLIALLNAGDSQHREVIAALDNERDEFVVSPFVLAELDSLVVSRWGVDRELAMLTAIRERCEIATFDADDLVAATNVIARYEDHEIGLTDASIVVLAQRYSTNTVLTLDRRHFRVLRGNKGRPFRLLPDDRRGRPTRRRA